VPQAEPPPRPDVRQKITTAPVEGATVNNTVNIARNYSTGTGVGATESLTQNSMAPQLLRVPAGTVVTFTNPAGNTKNHCVTQFFEGLFASPPLKPGESFQYKFEKRGNYYYNDCTSPSTTGEVQVY
jgi:plastocyanin